MKRNIVLIGFMGSGKTSVGKLLAQKLGYTFIDTDERIEKEYGGTINEIFQEKGEAFFRTMETETISKMENRTEKAVISTGGGLPMRKCNGEILKKLGFVVYLKVERDTVIKRLEGDTTRPLLACENPAKKIDDLLTYRDPMYEIASHLVLDTDAWSVDEAAEEIIRNYTIMISNPVRSLEEEEME